MSEVFEKRSIINGAQLTQHIDKNVSILLRIEQLSSGSMKGLSPDSKMIEVKLPYTVDVGSGEWVEVIGVPSSSTTITAKEVIMLSGDKDPELDTNAYEMAVLFLQHTKDIYG